MLTNWVLIISMWSGSTSGGVFIKEIDGFNENGCAIAAVKVENLYPKEWRPVSAIRAICVKKESK